MGEEFPPLSQQRLTRDFPAHRISGLENEFSDDDSLPLPCRARCLVYKHFAQSTAPASSSPRPFAQRQHFPTLWSRTMTLQRSPPTETSPASEILVGIDWADRLHALHVVYPDRQPANLTLEQEPETIDGWLAQLAQSHPQARVIIALEQSEGALVAALLKFPQVTIYPVNPTQLANYRKAMSHSGAKNDPADALLLCQFLQHYRGQLRALTPDDPATREMAWLVEDRRIAVDQRTAVTLELMATLKQYFPLVLKLVDAQLYATFIQDLLRKWPTLDKLQQVKTATLRSFFYGHNIRGDVVEKRIELIRTATPLTSDPALLAAGTRRSQKCAALLKAFNASIEAYDERLQELLAAHADYPLVAALPGAGLQMRTRLIAAFGQNRDRFPSAEEMQCLSGIAPVTRQSGRTKTVHHRWACPKFLKQTFHEYAGLSIRACDWANAYYHLQLERGKTKQMAKRALAYKWTRILFRCWKDRVPYNDATYLASLQRTGSPLLKFLPQPTAEQSVSHN
jgi:transposase